MFTEEVLHKLTKKTEFKGRQFSLGTHAYDIEEEILVCKACLAFLQAYPPRESTSSW